MKDKAAITYKWLIAVVVLLSTIFAAEYILIACHLDGFEKVRFFDMASKRFKDLWQEGWLLCIIAILGEIVIPTISVLIVTHMINALDEIEYYWYHTAASLGGVLIAQLLIFICRQIVRGLQALGNLIMNASPVFWIVFGVVAVSLLIGLYYGASEGFGKGVAAFIIALLVLGVLTFVVCRRNQK